MLKRVLIANRGEIALRVIRACKELGLESVAIYSDADRYALHVKRADRSHSMGEDALDAYLNIHRIIKAAKLHHCDAIHPGYGFLSENAEFARACEKAGITFIGPTAQVIEKMGSKTTARAIMQKAGVPVIPGSEGELNSLAQAKKVAKKIGYPVMLKATYGGGGRGIRICEDESALTQAFPLAQSESLKAFGKESVFIEKVLVGPRHIEVQILADNFGKTVHLFERDCSIQRRHQKLVEIAPSITLKEASRKKLYAYALAAAKAVGYQNAGTVEFLLDAKDNIYFLEMNTRLQVEHPITEAITGIDIVQQQLLIASNQPLAITQKQISLRGFACEFRINAEDPKNDFLPSFGKVTRYYAPGGPSVRTDSAIYTGYVIPSDYDSLCAKLTVWALDWPSVINRARRALEEMQLFGVKTTIPYYLEMLKTHDFKKGMLTTGFVDTHPELLHYSQKTLPLHRAAVIASSIAALHGL